MKMVQISEEKLKSLLTENMELHWAANAYYEILARGAERAKPAKTSKEVMEERYNEILGSYSDAEWGRLDIGERREITQKAWETAKAEARKHSEENEAMIKAREMGRKARERDVSDVSAFSV